MKPQWKDHSLFFLVRTILLNDRLRMYGSYIRLAREKGYVVCPMRDFYIDRMNIKARHFVLRHDVDHVSPATRKMFEAERRLGVRSTYYFRFGTMDLPLMRDMIQEGFEVGLHYETLSDYIRENRITDIGQADLQIVRERLRHEIEEFNETVGMKMTSCASHGAPENVRLKCSNNILLEGEDPAAYDILFEAYDRALYEKFVDCHIMDGSILYNFGFSYRDNPVDAVREDKRNIVFLAHPNHWYASPRVRAGQAAKLILGRARFSSDRQFRRISGG